MQLHGRHGGHGCMAPDSWIFVAIAFSEAFYDSTCVIWSLGYKLSGWRCAF
jgi:hypothetical protein